MPLLYTDLGHRRGAPRLNVPLLVMVTMGLLPDTRTRELTEFN